MKSFNKIWGIGLLAFLLIAVAPVKSRAQDISSQDFYDNLSQYGTWINDPQYGDVWVPDAEDDFMPYGTQGHWVLTEYGNTWVSDYPWGWATFHYGRWHYDDYYGWEWIPGYEWAPAWVSWREGGGYYSWAPLMPGISISLAFGSGYHVPNRYWVCAPQAYINSPNIRNYYVPHTRMVTIIRNTTIINNTYVRGNQRYIAGPRAADIQQVTHQRPVVYNINNASRPGAINVHNNAVNIYRPAVKKAPDARPERVVDGAAYRQQNPNQGIARKGPGGAAAFDHANAAKLATVARSSAPDNKVVRVNNRPNGGQPNNPAQPGNGPGSAQHNRPGQPATQPNNPVSGQPANPDNRMHNRPDQQIKTPAMPQQANPAPGQPAATPDNRQHNRPGQAATTPAAPLANPAPGQPAVNPDNRQQNHRGRPENRPNVAPANPGQPAAAPQSAQPDNSAQQAQREAQRQQRQAQQAQQHAQQQQAQAQQAQQQAHQT